MKLKDLKNTVNVLENKLNREKSLIFDNNVKNKMATDNQTKELSEDDLDLIREYTEKGKILPGFYPFVTYDMVQVGYPRPTAGLMIARDHGGTNEKGELYPSTGMWCKVNDILPYIEYKDSIKERINDLINVISLTEHKIGLDTLKEIRNEI